MIRYVVVRDVEGGLRTEACAFSSLEEAWLVYEQAERVCDNDPDEFGEGDPTTVSKCWLYEVDAEDTDQAAMMGRDHHGRPIASYSDEDFRNIEI